MKATEFFATFSSHSGQECKRTADSKPATERPVAYVDSRLNDEWVKVAQWADGSQTMHSRYEVYPTKQNAKRLLAASREHQAEAERQKSEAPETREQANRREVAKKLALVMRDSGVSASAARQGGLDAVGDRQELAQRCFRRAVAYKAGCRDGYVPSDATWQLACDMLEVAQ